MKRAAGEWIAVAVLGLAVAAPALAGSVVDTRHNLSVSGPGPVKSTSETEICIFCHTPHQARSNIPFLWNRADSTATYTTYTSSTLFASVGQPTGASKLCLSCHDGTIALGSVLSRATPIEFPGSGFMPSGPALLGTDISDDHPISFVYDAALASANGELESPALLTGAVRLDNAGELQCTACHNPHDDTFGKFLVMPNNASALCTTCHQRTGWPTSSHATSGATWNGASPDPWPHTDYTTVSENGCENCHSPHTAGGHARLLNFPLEEANCLSCHNGNVAATDIEAELGKVTRHPVDSYTGVHDPAENALTMPTHVECTDCHNPHQVDASSASPPNLTGPLKGARGVSAAGSEVKPASYSYEVCFRCHADNPVSLPGAIVRQVNSQNTRHEFDLSNPSYHPVEGPGQNPDVPSLYNGYTESSVIYCTDCHNNDQGPGNGGAGPKGPHGSSNPFLLERSYSTADFSGSTATSTAAICYKCHDKRYFTDKMYKMWTGFKEHRKHVVGEKAPCSTCHDPHGVRATAGTGDHSHLINFDTSIVSPRGNGDLRFVDKGNRSGSCYLVCHGKDHKPFNY